MPQRIRHASRDVTLQLGLASLAAAAKLEKQRILVGQWAEKPDDPAPPKLPRDLPKLDENELMELYRKLNRWARYLVIQLAAAEVDERYADAVVDRLSAFAQIKNRGEKNVSTMKALVYDDPEFVKAKDAAGEAYAYRKLVGALHQAVDMDYSHVSREITRRSNVAARDGRNRRYND